MGMWSALRSDAAVYRRLRYPGSRGMWPSLALWLRPGGLLVLFGQRLGHTVRIRRSSGSPWTLSLLVMRIVQQCASYASVIFAKCDVLSSIEIEPGVYLADGGHLIIGAQRIGTGTIIHHRVTIGMNLTDEGKPTLGANVWIGPDTVIYGSITIGDGATILPGTVLTKSIPGGAVVQGNPARVVRTGFDNAPLRSSADCNVDATSLPSPSQRLPTAELVATQQPNSA